MSISVAATAPAAGARILGFWMCTALVVGNIIGTGIFVMPAALAPYGLNAVTGWGVTALGCLFLAIVLAGLARTFSLTTAPMLTSPAFGAPAFRHVVLLDFDWWRTPRSRSASSATSDVLPGADGDAALVRRHGHYAGVVLRTDQPARRTPPAAQVLTTAEVAAAAGRGGPGAWLLVQHPGALHSTRLNPASWAQESAC